jgi:ATPase subunit of ABC transporter with duplicated ATPase domains
VLTEGVVGLNGSGKSTLLRIMSGEEKEIDGIVIVCCFIYFCLYGKQLIVILG